MTIGHGFHATMTAKPGKGGEVLDILLHAPSLADDDCVVFLVGRSAADPDTIFVTEGWTSVEAHSAFFTSEPAQTLVARLQALLAGESAYIDEIPVGGKAAFRENEAS
ncbi:antibiotic biosynthesis monooxygenase [Micromonospora craterilacus]|uniref:Antibiotic biosynthesis monooxygenase n=1 Tax=Micromonospora craterilacus TaxID=1655439 RepID=A0A2W2EC74_9ACTN|nr:antibiotic biosynthesis monooxygenase [Micromonospora craterilacus]PZG20123.1 antibiotic biosynthesis monooxygenase [Micromonospora craterilacus]